MTTIKRELFLHYAFCLSFFVFITLFKQYFSWGVLIFWLGGVVGTILPDIDHIIYFYFIKPGELTSQRFNFLAQKGEIKRMVALMYETRTERKNLIFHTFFFQMFFLVLTFWMMSSSSSMFGRGLVLSFALHLSIDQLIDMTDLKSFDNWTKYSPVQFSFRDAKLYWLGTTILLLIFGFFL